MHIEIDAKPYKICLNYHDSLQNGANIIRLPDGVEASCHSWNGLLLMLEVLGGRQWWQIHHSQIIRDVLLHDHEC